MYDYLVTYIWRQINLTLILGNDCEESYCSIDLLSFCEQYEL